jgi:hypothetical protein
MSPIVAVSHRHLVPVSYAFLLSGNRDDGIPCASLHKSGWIIRPEGVEMPSRRRSRPLRLGDRARSKLNRRVGMIDAVERVDGQLVYGLHYDEEPQDHFIATPGHDGAQLRPELVERVK